MKIAPGSRRLASQVDDHDAQPHEGRACSVIARPPNALVRMSVYDPKFRFGCIRRCQAQAVPTMVVRSESVGSKPNSLRARTGSATSTARIAGPQWSGRSAPSPLPCRSASTAISGRDRYPSPSLRIAPAGGWHVAHRQPVG